MSYPNNDTARTAEWMVQHQGNCWERWADAIWMRAGNATPSKISTSEISRCRLGNEMLAKALAGGRDVGHVAWTDIADVFLANAGGAEGYVPLGIDKSQN